jgi:hypothetical protein
MAHNKWFTAMLFAPVFAGLAGASNFRVVEDPMAVITDEHPARWVVQWTAPKEYEAPVDLEIRRVHYNMKWKKIESADGKAEPVPRKKKDGGEPASKEEQDPVLAAFRIEGGVKTGDPYQFAITAMGPPFSGVTTVLQLLANNDVQGSVGLTMHSGPAQRLQLIARPGLQKDGRVRVVLLPVDALGYPARFAEPLPVTVWEGSRALWEGRVQEAEQLLINVPDDSVVRLIAKTRIDGVDETIVSNPIWPAPIRGNIANLGDLHWHSELSNDATRGIVEGLAAARDCLNNDFSMPTDHAPEGERWAETVKACDRFNEPDHFATVFGWERSSARGHVNFYFTDPDHAMNPDNFEYPREPAEYIGTIPHRDFVAIPHHTNSRGRIRNGKDAFGAYPWGNPADEYLRLIEIMQTRGNYEREDSPDGWRTDGHNNGASAQAALAMGHKLGFVGGTDNHKGWPCVTRNTGRIFTGLWTKRRERQEVYNALHARHSWACWDTRAIVLFEIGSAMQGDELKLEQPQNLTAQIRLSVEAPLDVLDIVTEDDRVIPVDIAGESLDIDKEADLGTVDESTFFYLRARQSDGALIYASPIFITVEKQSAEHRVSATPAGSIFR